MTATNSKASAEPDTTTAPTRLLDDMHTNEGVPHPVLWHPYLLTAWAGAAGVGVSTLDPSTLVMAGSAAGAGALGALVGSASIDVRSEEQYGYVYAGGAVGALAGVGMAGFAWWAETAGLSAQLWQPHLWATLAIGGTAWGALYTALRLRLQAARVPGSKIAKKLKKKHYGSDYAQIFEEAKFGQVTLVELTSNWAGERALIDLDDEQDYTSKNVLTQTSQDKLTAVARRVFKRERGIKLPDGALTFSRVLEDAGQVVIDVKLRDVLTSSIDPPDDYTKPVTDPDQPMNIGVYQSGDLMYMPESGPHGIAQGTTGSGKSTYYRAQLINYARRPHVVVAAVGTSKLYGLLSPFVKPAVQGIVSRPPFALIGGGDGGSPEEYDSAVKGLMAAYMLYRVRMDNPDLPRDGGGNLIPSKEHPRFVLYIDEVNDLVSRSKLHGSQHKTHTLPNGEKITVPKMLEHLTSKGRSEGVELEIGTQRMTDGFMGFSNRDMLNNVHRRAVFYGFSVQDAKVVSGDDRINPKAIPKHSMRFAAGEGQHIEPGKVYYYTHTHITEALAAAEANGTLGDLSGQEAEALGELWAQRWSSARIGHILRYYKGSIGTVASLNDGASQSDVSTGAASSQTPSQEQGTGKAPPIGARDPKLQAAIEKAHREVDQNAMEDEVLRDVERVDEWLAEVATDVNDGRETATVPTEPAELLAFLLSAWEAVEDAPVEATTQMLVEQFDLHELDPYGEGNQKRAVMELSQKLQEEIGVEPRTGSGRQKWYALDSLRAAWERIEGSPNTDANDDDEDGVS